MRAWTTTNFTGHWPVGCAAVVVAESATDAAMFLNWDLKLRGLAGDAEAEHMSEVPIISGSVRILCDGDY